MVTRFNFGSEQSPVPRGYILDFGEAYSPSEGYGWVEQADSTTPLDIVGNGRKRNLSNNQLLDSFVHMQYPEDGTDANAVSTPAAWVHDVKNGRYRVSVGVGDLLFDDSAHSINVEGVSLISNFVPNSGTSIRFSTRQIDVTDGQLTVDAIGGENTKIVLFEFNSVTDTRINFGTSGTPGLDNYIRDIGQGYSNGKGFGWVTQDSLNSSQAEPIDVSPNGRERSLIEDVVSDSLIHMQYPDFVTNPEAVMTPAAWEYELPEGEYRITVQVGDPGFTDSTHVINVEDINFIDSFNPTSDIKFERVTQVVDVNDGRLTVDAIGGINTKLNYVRVSPITDVKINFGAEDIEGVPEEYYADSGLAYSDSRGYGWITQDSLGEDDPVLIDNSENIRFRDIVPEDPLLDSLIHLQYPDSGDKITANRTPSAWEYAIPNGEYEVKVSVGDPSFTDSIHVVNIEGVEVISGFIPDSDSLFLNATRTVEVTDGKLTVDAIGGENTKLNFIEIASIEQ